MNLGVNGNGNNVVNFCQKNSLKLDFHTGSLARGQGMGLKSSLFVGTLVHELKLAAMIFYQIFKMTVLQGPRLQGEVPDDA